jgi:hypothetical protein
MLNQLCIMLCAGMLALASPVCLHGQCLTAPAVPAACTGSESLVTDGSTINTATTKWFYAGSATAFDNLTMNGGTLIVCGDLIVDKFFFISGTIFIRPGARFAVGTGTGSDMQGNCAIYNYGTLELYRSIGMKNVHASALQPNIIINATASSVFNINNNYLVIDNPYSWFINNGNANFHGLVLDPGCAVGCICMASNSQFHIDHLVNKTFNTFTAPSGGACFSVTQLSQFCEQLTNNPAVYACINPGHHTDSTCLVAGGKHNAWGNAQVFNVCPGCNTITILPVRFTAFIVEPYRQTYQLQWKASGYPAHSRFRVDRSADGIHFSAIETTTIAETSAGVFKCTDQYPLAGINYYRITCINPVNGLANNSMIVMARAADRVFLPVRPNPFSTHFYISLSSSAPVLDVKLSGINGQPVAIDYMFNKGTQVLEVFVTQKISPGIYTVQVKTGKGLYVQKLVQQ